MSYSRVDDLLINKDFTTIFVERESNLSILDLLDQIGDEIQNNIITQFGLSHIYDDYKKGGVVDTVHNARQDIFTSAEREERFKEGYNHKNYEGRIIQKKDLNTGNTIKSDRRFTAQRKETFQKNDYVVDGYTGEKLVVKKPNQKTESASRIHIDHIVSAKEYHNDDLLRLHADSNKRNDLATDSSNLTFTEGSLNQSKGEKDLMSWKETTQKKETEQNKHRFGVNDVLAKEKYKVAKKHKKVSKIKIVSGDYAKNITKAGTKRGLEQAKKQIVGILIYEINNIIFKAMLPVIRKWNDYNSISERVSDIKRRLKISLSKAKSELTNIA